MWRIFIDLYELDSLVDTLFLRLLDLVMTTYTKNQRLITGNRVYDRALEVLDHI